MKNASQIENSIGTCHGSYTQQAALIRLRRQPRYRGLVAALLPMLTLSISQRYRSFPMNFDVAFGKKSNKSNNLGLSLRLAVVPFTLRTLC